MSATAQATLYDQLHELVLPLLEAYHNDLLVHDRCALEACPGIPFLHWTRRTGTDLVFLPAVDDRSWPAPGEVVPFLFGTADRDHLLASKLISAEYHSDKHVPRSLLVLYFDGRRLRQIDEAQAVKIAREYRDRIEAEWERARAR